MKNKKTQPRHAPVEVFLRLVNERLLHIMGCRCSFPFDITLTVYEYIL